MSLATSSPFWAVDSNICGHSSAIRCLKFSRGASAGSVFATGGDDKKVNLWRVGRADSGPVTTMSGNASPVVSLCFSPTSEQLLSASEGGSLKIFDIAEGRVARSLNGHLARVNGVDYHPYGEFVASGGDDTNVKVWDVRHKRCIQTYKGHSRYVSDVKFSPDGAWVASCSKEDGTLKVWDLIAGKIMHSFTIASEGAPASPVSFEFNPNEFLMAVQTANNAVKFFDMEKFEHIYSTPNDPSRVNKIAWSLPSDGEDGQASLLSATTDGLRSWEIEPELRCNAGTEARWGGNVSDMVVNSANQLVLGSFSKDVLSVFAVELASLPARGADYGSEFKEDVGSNNDAVVAGRHSRSSRGQTPTGKNTPGKYYNNTPGKRDSRASPLQNTPSASSLGVGVVGHSIEKKKKEGFSSHRTPSPAQNNYIVETPPSSEAKMTGGSRRRLSESPLPPTFHYDDSKGEGGQDGDEEGLSIMMPNEFRSNRRGGGGEADDSEYMSDAEAKELADRIVSMNEHKEEDETLNSSNNSTGADTTRGGDLGHIYDFAGAMGAATPYSGNSTPTQSPAKNDSEKQHSPFAGDLEDAVVAASAALRKDENKENNDESKPVVSFGGGSEGGGGGGGNAFLNYNLPSSTFHNGNNGNNGNNGSSQMKSRGGGVDSAAKDDQIIGQVLLGRLGLSVCLSERIEKIKVLRKKWAAGKVSECFRTMSEIMDDDDDGSLEGAAVVADFLKSIDVRSKKVMKLDICVELLEILVKMILPEGEDADMSLDGTLNSLNESTIAIRGRPFAELSMSYFSLILEGFGRYVFETCMNGGSGVGVDVEREAKLEKCLGCHKRMCGGGEDLDAKDDGGGGSGIVFMGLVDLKDAGAKRAAKRLGGLLSKYKKGKI
ncbi:hypothetical protein TL16_g12609 [Triparma laevis f. inornata]|uniref:Katanin p80 subunit C-terminal domain-containing protein n=2 Tax=Triparma laevis TaxID=1534972 RepID=A0A9W7A3N8_9STRA|nr:hypothetical protein TrLO_g6533 [Triparma laevis f. longispina]GMH93367.1 hypothetical protein TL16_g12609 [Triparma laevis f. inornata]